MRIHSLELQNFRNYPQLRLVFNRDFIVFLGNNAQGKTNLLESIYLSATGKSYRTYQDSDLIHWNQPVGYIRLEFERNQIRHQIEISISPSEKKIKLDGKLLTRRSELIGQLALVLFTPDDLELIKGDPSIRRKFLDFEISETHPVYLHALQRYYRALKQRNISLREVKLDKAGLDLVTAWNSQMIEFGSEIVYQRYQTIQQLNNLVSNIYSQIVGDGDKLELIYQTQFSEYEIQDKAILLKSFQQKLEELQKEEIKRGITLIGPQRDDIVIQLNGHDLHSTGSQGEQRSTVLALKLAEIQLIKSEIGEYPVVALDDFMSELDENHIDHLLHSLTPDIQTFITAIHTLPSQSKNQNIQYYHIQNGIITT